MVKTIPAIPGNVKTAPKEESTPKMKNIFAKRAILDTNPAVFPNPIIPRITKYFS